VTGEALSQVASQTLQSLSFTDYISDLLILRPLIGFDKEEIISVARRIGTYDISILPYEDCCTIFSPRHPLIKPDREIVTRHYREAALGEVIEEAIEQEEIIAF
jgi:thiamine biosynthesis protein ThiI